jgi:hypothetical protein
MALSEIEILSCVTECIFETGSMERLSVTRSDTLQSLGLDENDVKTVLDDIADRLGVTFERSGLETNATVGHIVAHIQASHS